MLERKGYATTENISGIKETFVRDGKAIAPQFKIQNYHIHYDYLATVVRGLKAPNVPLIFSLAKNEDCIQN